MFALSVVQLEMQLKSRQFLIYCEKQAIRKKPPNAGYLGYE
jgi:hypothetical protein